MAGMAGSARVGLDHPDSGIGAALMSNSYPLTSEVVCVERVARWRPLVNWVLVIPLSVWAAVLGYGAAVVSLADR